MDAKEEKHEALAKDCRDKDVPSFIKDSPAFREWMRKDDERLRDILDLTKGVYYTGY